MMETHAHVIVTGNEKGGSGKTTTAMHLAVAMLKLGFNVSTIDIDARQRSLTRYLENRAVTAKEKEMDLPSPHHFVVAKAKKALLEEKEREESQNFLAAFAEASAGSDFLIIDAPGSDTFLARFAHSYADTVITPMNDSFLDLDVIGIVRADDLKVIKPSVYSEMVFQQKIVRAGRDGGSIDWVVMRNRMSSTAARNKKNVEKALNELSRRVAFRTAPGFNERVIYRELFLNGLTVLDVLDKKAGIAVSMSHLAARMEVRTLLRALNIEKISSRLASSVETMTAKTRARTPKASTGNQLEIPLPNNPYYDMICQLAVLTALNADNGEKSVEEEESKV